MLTKQSNSKVTQGNRPKRSTVMKPFTLERSSLSELSKALKGRVITPDAAGFDEARTVFYGNIDRRPALIVRPVDVADVAYDFFYSRVAAGSREIPPCAAVEHDARLFGLTAGD